MPLQPLILCPLAREAALLGRCARGLPAIELAGPGQDAGASVARLARRGQLVVLAGTAGGLGARWPVGTAAVLSEVISADAPLAPPLRSPVAASLTAGSFAITARAVTVKAPVSSPEAKAALADRSGADLVDCESFHVAQAAEALGCPWLIVRGVSDGPRDSLPREASGWIDARGRVRPWRLALDLLRSPRLAGRLPALSRDSARAMEAVAALLLQVIEPALRASATPPASSAAQTFVSLASSSAPSS